MTYKSGRNISQIDYVMCRRKHVKEVRNCKVINGENVAPQEEDETKMHKASEDKVVETKKEVYRVARKNAKKAVAKAKMEAINEAYEALDGMDAERQLL
ncbi:hypothetical protein J437_LFUL015207 [Ladona fulva]|uniref:Uncharacterized protein n=1 Tax=Ladona fulva TaxID=123851 RepID=A0A8K0KIH5_LADFU|nr:hypothetical protein J437_LFUL015207 [Ladona fulva]